MKLNFNELQSQLIADIEKEAEETLAAARICHAHANTIARSFTRFKEATTIEELTEIEENVEWGKYA